MPERVLPESLSGLEIRTAVVDKLMTRLAKDGHLNVAHAYDHFSYKVSVHIELHDLGRIEKVDVTEAETLVQGEGEDALLDQFDAELEGAQTDPNTMREETNQEIPVLTKNAEGKPEIKGIKYPRKKK